MPRLCPRGQENSAFFNCLYLNKLPRELRILRSEADMADKQALGARADLFAAHNSKQAHDVVAAVAAGPSSEQEGEDTTVAAVRPGAGSGQHGGGGGQKGGGGSRQQGWRLDCATSTLSTEPRQGHAGLPAPGRKSRRPGAAQRRRRRAADPHAGSDIKQAFPRGDLVGTAVQTDGGDLFFSPQRQSSQRRSSHRRSSQRRSSQRRSSQHQTNIQQSGRAGCKSLPTCSGVPMVPPPSLQHAAEWQSRCRWCHHLSSTQHLLSGDVTSLEDQRSPSADQGLPQRRTSGMPCDPVCANPNLAVACASAPPVSEPEPGGGVRFRYRRSFLLTSTHWPWPSVSCRGRFSRPSSQDAGRSFSPACTFVKMQNGGGSCGGSYSCLLYLNIIFVICVSLLWRQGGSLSV
jgi:hypothetical protein